MASGGDSAEGAAAGFDAQQLVAELLSQARAFASDEKNWPALAVSLVALVCIPALLAWLADAFSRGGGIGRRRRDAVVFVGPSGTGKTALFFKMLYGEAPQTLTSMAPTEKRAPSGKVVVDYPGHPRLRAGLDEWVSRAVAFVFVLDASNPRSGPREGAEFLFDLLTDPRLEGGPPILVACNKSDVVGAKAPEKIRQAVEREVEELRKTRAAMADVGSEGGSGGAPADDRLPLGRPGQKFKFAEDAPCDISFAACSTADGDFGDVGAFLEEHAGEGAMA